MQSPHLANTNPQLPRISSFVFCIIFAFYMLLYRILSQTIQPVERFQFAPKEDVQIPKKIKDMLAFSVISFSHCTEYDSKSLICMHHKGTTYRKVQ